MQYQVVLPTFEGPMDLLLHLIDQNALDIYNIPIAFITKEYLVYMNAAQEIDLSLSGEFVVMAGTLLAIKARMLLPKRAAESTEADDVIDPRDALVEKLIEYRHYKEKAKELLEQAEDQQHVYYRNVNYKHLIELFNPPNPVGHLTPSFLAHAFQEIMSRAESRPKMIELAQDEYTVTQQSRYIIERLMEQPQGMAFHQLFHKPNISFFVVTFMALLELMHKNLIWVRQNDLYGSIHVFLTNRIQEAGNDIIS